MNELVVDKRTGEVRQAGAAGPGRFVAEFRRRAEQSLFVFAKGVLGYHFLSPHLHRRMCQFLADVPIADAPWKRRKLTLVPRFHGKSLLGCNALPLHMLIQPAEHNLYFPKLPGSETRILIAGEKLDRAQDHLRVMQTSLEQNTLLRALWPHIVWEDTRAARKWNDSEFVVPRAREYPDPSVRAIGVGGAITGAHPNVIIEDDLTTQEAASSPIVMRAAIECHVAWRALLPDPVRDLQYVFGTRWAVQDLPGYIIANDPSFEVLRLEVVEDGQPIWPEKFSLRDVESWKQEFGTMFPLFFLNRATDASLVDFQIDDVRHCEITPEGVVFETDERDEHIAGARAQARGTTGWDEFTQLPYTADLQTRLRHEHLWRVKR